MRSRRLDQHRAGEEELSDIERAETVEQPARPVDRDLLVKRTGRTREVVVGSQVDDRCEPAAVLVPQPPESCCDAVVVAHVDADPLRRQVPRAMAREAHDPEVSSQAAYDSTADEAAAAGDQDSLTIGHGCEGLWQAV